MRETFGSSGRGRREEDIGAAEVAVVDNLVVLMLAEAGATVVA